jgi:hypothetical protein
VRRAVLPVLFAAVALAGCGGDDEQTSATQATPAPPPSQTATATPTATATATPTPSATATAQPSPTATSPEDQPGGAGDEEAIRVPAEFTISPAGKITPPQISVPAFLQIEITVRNRSGRPVDVTWASDKLMTVQPHGGASTIVKGRKKGSYVLSANPGGDALIVTGVEPGP